MISTCLVTYRLKIETPPQRYGSMNWRYITHLEFYGIGNLITSSFRRQRLRLRVSARKGSYYLSLRECSTRSDGSLLLLSLQKCLCRDSRPSVSNGTRNFPKNSIRAGLHSRSNLKKPRQFQYRAGLAPAHQLLPWKSTDSRMPPNTLSPRPSTCDFFMRLTKLA